MQQIHIPLLRNFRAKIALVVFFAVYFMSAAQMTHFAYAASCTNPNNYGSATLSVSIPSTGAYTVWTRMKVPSSTHSTAQLEVDGATCWQIGGSNTPTNTWTWVDWRDANSSQKNVYTFTTTGAHSIRIIGSATDVQVDKIILLGVGEQCSDKTSTPFGDGNNCASAPAVTSTMGGNGQGATGQVVAGSTTPGIVTANQANAEKTSYIVNGKVVQSSNGAVALDTTKLSDGTYEVKTVVKLKDGTEVTETQTITIRNNKSFFQKYRIYLFIAVAVVLCGTFFVVIRIGKFNPGQLFARFLPAQSAAKSSAPIEMPQYSETIIRPTNNTLQKH